MAKNGKFLSEIKLNNGSTWSLRASDHALARMGQRDVDAYAATAAVIALGESILTELKETGDEAMVLDEDRGFALVVGFKLNTAWIITVIDKARCYAKTGTRVYQLGG